MRESNRLDRAEVEFFKEIQLLIANSGTIGKARESRLEFHKICGVDAAYSSDGSSVIAVAALLVEGKMAETSTCSGKFTFPYVSGLFYLHEGPFVVAAVRRLKETPQLVCFDGHGAAHPNFAGIATICGRVLGFSSIGIAKSRLVGNEIPYRDGLNKIEFENQLVGYVTSKPRRYWSPGFFVSMEDLETIIRSGTGKTCREAIQFAHIMAKREMRLHSKV